MWYTSLSLLASDVKLSDLILRCEVSNMSLRYKILFWMAFGISLIKGEGVGWWAGRALAFGLGFKGGAGSRRGGSAR